MAPYRVAVSHFKDLKLYRLPQFGFHFEFPNLVVIRLLSETLWMLSKSPCCMGPSLNAPVCCCLSACVRPFKEQGPCRRAKPTVLGSGVFSMGSVHVGLLLHDVIRYGALLLAPRL